MAENYEQILASVISYLLQGDDREQRAAQVLLLCNLEEIRKHNSTLSYVVSLSGSRSFVESIKMRYHRPNASVRTRQGMSNQEAAENTSNWWTIEQGFKAVLGDMNIIFEPLYSLIEIDNDWRIRLLAESETQEVTNQNPYSKEPLIWNGMRFSSKPEVEIAKALDRVGVLYLPNCLARVGEPKRQYSKILDFLISYGGKWGVLEVDGKTYHSPQSATQDHDRRRLFEKHGGIAFFDRYPAGRCMNEPDKVVQEFLNILKNK